jgi:hypothetical protein
MRNAIIIFIALALVMFGGRYLVGRRASSPAPAHVPSADGSFALRPPRRRAVLLGAVALFPAAVLGLVTFLTWRSGAESVRAGVVATTLAAAAAAYLLAWSIRSRVVVRETGLERVGLFRRRLIAWTAVAKIAFNTVQRWFFLTMSDGTHLWLRADIPGIGDFAVVALRRLNPTVLQAADACVREVLEELAEAVRRETRGN